MIIAWSKPASPALVSAGDTKAAAGGVRAELPPGYALNPLQLCSVFPELGKGHRQNSLHCSTLQSMLWEAWGVSASAYLKGHEICVSLAVARSRAHSACTVPYCTARGFMVHGSLCSDFICDQPRAQRAWNMTEVRNPALNSKNLKPCFGCCCGCKCCNDKTQQCGAHSTAKPHILARRRFFGRKKRTSSRESNDSCSRSQQEPSPQEPL